MELKRAPYLYDFWELWQREQMVENLEQGVQKIKEYSEYLARKSLFSMKLNRSPLFRAEILELLVRSPESWKLIRKNIRQFALRYKKYNQIKILKDYNPILGNLIVDRSKVECSNFMTWGVVFFESPLKMTKENQEFLINLLGSAFETGIRTLIAPLSSSILEKFLSVSMDHLAFVSVHGKDNLSDYCRLQKSRFVVEKNDPFVMDWLFSKNGELKEDPLSKFLKLLFPVIFFQDFNLIVEIIMDLGDVSCENQIMEQNQDITEIILMEYWKTLSEETQNQLLNNWPNSDAIYNLANILLSLNEKYCFQFFIQLFQIMSTIGYSNQNLEYLLEFWKLFKKEKNFKTFKPVIELLVENLYEENQISKKNEIMLYLKEQFPKNSGIQKWIIEFQKECIEKYKPDLENVLKKKILKESIMMRFGDIIHAKEINNSVTNEELITLDEGQTRSFNYTKAKIAYYNKEWKLALDLFTELCQKTPEDHSTLNWYICIINLMADNHEQFFNQFEEYSRQYSYKKNMMMSQMRDLYWDIIALKGVSYLEIIIDTYLQKKTNDIHELCVDMGHIAADLGFYEQAILIFERGLRMEPKNSVKSTLLNNIGTIYTEINQYDKAIEKYHQSLELDSSNGRTWLNLGKTYDFKGETIKANECFDNAKQRTEKNDSSPAELYCTSFETTMMSLLVTQVINYVQIPFENVKLQFKTADRFYDDIFPKEKEIQELASSIFMHYGNGVELMYHESFGKNIIKDLKEQYGDNLIDLPPSEKDQIPKDLRILLYEKHIGIGTWAKIIQSFRNRANRNPYLNYGSCFIKFSTNELEILKNTAEFTAKWRNPSDHAEIINFDTVKLNKGNLIYKINQTIEILSQDEI